MKIIQHLKKEKKHLKNLVCGIHENHTTFEERKKTFEEPGVWNTSKSDNI